MKRATNEELIKAPWLSTGQVPEYGRVDRFLATEDAENVVHEGKDQRTDLRKWDRRNVERGRSRNGLFRNTVILEEDDSSEAGF